MSGDGDGGGVGFGVGDNDGGCVGTVIVMVKDWGRQWWWGW